MLFLSAWIPYLKQTVGIAEMAIHSGNGKLLKVAYILHFSCSFHGSHEYPTFEHSQHGQCVERRRRGRERDVRDADTTAETNTFGICVLIAGNIMANALIKHCQGT